MGVYDVANYRVACKCGACAEARVSDKGHPRSGASWQSGPHLEGFKVTWRGGGREEPAIVCIECKTCGQTPTVEKKYGL